MNKQFIRSFAGELIENESFIPVDKVEGLLTDGTSRMLIREAPGKLTIIELIDGDEMAYETIKGRILNQCAGLEHAGEQVETYMFLIFKIDMDQQKTVLFEEKCFNQFEKGEHQLKCCSVSIEKKQLSVYFSAPILGDSLVRLLQSHLDTQWQLWNDDVFNAEVYREKQQENTIVAMVEKPFLTYILIGINVAVFVLLSILAQNDPDRYNQLLGVFGSKKNGLIVLGEYWRLIASMFLHGNLMHLLVNCYSLNIVGGNVERIFGRKNFLWIYFLSGLLGSLCSFAFSTYDSVGASGAIFGLLGALLFLAIQKPILFKTGFGSQIVAVVLINLGFGFTVRGIDNFAHMGGLLGGVLTSALQNPPIKRFKINTHQGAIGVLVLALLGMGWYGFAKPANIDAAYGEEVNRYFKAQKYNEVIEAGEQLLKTDLFPNTQSSILVQMVVASVRNAQLDQAERYAQQLIEGSPDIGNVLLSMIYLEKQEYDKAAEAIDAAEKNGANAADIAGVRKQLEKLKTE